MKRLTAATLWLALGLLAPAASEGGKEAADDAKDVKTVIEKSVNAVLDVLRDKAVAKEDRRKRVMRVVTPVFNLPLMGKLALGKANWPKLNAAQRKEFTDLFIAAVQDSYYDKLDLFTDETVEFADPVSSEKDKYQMMTYLNSKGQRYKLLYKLHKAGAAWRVYDVEIEGISLIRTYGAQYDQILQAASPKDLLAKMREKSLDAPKKLKAAAKSSDKT